MKRSWLFLLASILATSGAIPLEAAVVRVESGPTITLTNRQPMQAVFVDSNGNSYQRTFYYDPALGGINLELENLGANTTVYFPELGTGYIWYNGYWVDQSGYYWNGSNRVYINNPQWNTYWTNHWHGHDGWHGNDYNRWDREDRYDHRSYWNGDHTDYHSAWQHGDWRGEDRGYRGNEHAGSWGGNVWQGKGHEGRDDDNWHGRDNYSGQRDGDRQAGRGGDHEGRGDNHKSGRR